MNTIDIAKKEDDENLKCFKKIEKINKLVLKFEIFIHFYKLANLSPILILNTYLCYIKVMGHGE